MKRENLAISRMMKDLSVANGGSLLKEIRKNKLSEDGILFIGLGGMGCDTINEIKRVYVHDFEKHDRIRFLAADTDLTTLEHTNSASYNGMLEDYEQFEIYDDVSAKLLINPTPEILSWLGEVDPMPLTARGANGVRQYGRVMLCGTDKYILLFDRIAALIKEVTDSYKRPASIILVSGISGGTGSGTFIDVSYMIRTIISDLRNTNKSNTVTSYGVFYMPDVQKEMPGLKENVATWTALKRNGYAALRELDYFMSNGQADGRTSPVYILIAPNGVKTVSSEPIFEKCHVFLVAPTGNLTNCVEIITQTAQSLLNMFQDIIVKEQNSNASKVQSILSNYDNNLSHVGE